MDPETEADAEADADAELGKMVVTLAGMPAVMIPPDPAVGRRTPPIKAEVLVVGQSGSSETSWYKSSPQPPPQVSVLSP
jgi:hypothetical protein